MLQTLPFSTGSEFLRLQCIFGLFDKVFGANCSIFSVFHQYIPAEVNREEGPR